MVEEGIKPGDPRAFRISIDAIEAEVNELLGQEPSDPVDELDLLNQAQELLNAALQKRR
ncbi:Uncharacterised protein [Corynebacterium renale]|uniref:Uncharacterized protein n=1 Tax=Corynebacterium renale TaxID=1724 RepID=A0A2A9DS87_9CORY|nr:hypothetical protein [Corynebacterium renale]PFG28779.1 hypothetical protein ATK06_1900 [Corynebacterium renale]SQG64629.1 Uncharacterised protein [Corynebacterium renale]SQI25887.1 Uncharacterised protein [Corynebacterium renale]STC95772.1 Uncharacterised protein [Corynebacterium renale]